MPWRLYTTNGKYRRQPGYKVCASIWGNCYNTEGKCGTGDDFYA